MSKVSEKKCDAMREFSKFRGRFSAPTFLQMENLREKQSMIE